MNPRAIVFCGLALAACQSLGDNGDVPARITGPTADSRAALRHAVGEMLHTEVQLADDALTRSSVLTIERNPPRTMQNLPATGRNLESPIQFRLVKTGASCVLIDGRNEERRVLENTTCVPE